VRCRPQVVRQVQPLIEHVTWGVSSIDTLLIEYCPAVARPECTTPRTAVAETAASKAAACKLYSITLQYNPAALHRFSSRQGCCCYCDTTAAVAAGTMVWSSSLHLCCCLLA
jgi:hypothetical protein